MRSWHGVPIHKKTITGVLAVAVMKKKHNQPPMSQNEEDVMMNATMEITTTTPIQPL